MIKNIYSILLLSQLFAFSGFTQGTPPVKITPIAVGDQLPKAFWDFKHLLLEQAVPREYTLTADKGKLLIIDFWASWCGSCIKRFPELESIEKAFPGKVKVLLVNSVGTGDSAESLIARFKSGSGTFTATKLAVIAADSVFLKAFPHKALPHYVWIADGSVRAVTTAELLTVENIGLLLKQMDVIGDRRKKIEAIRTKAKKD